MISTPDRRETVELIETAMAQGARQEKACEVVGLSARTYQRWTQQGGVEEDLRPLVERQAPANKLSEAERQQVLDTCNSPSFSALPPSQIVPMLADQGQYIASESSFYRLLREHQQLAHRGKAQAPRKVSKPRAHKASAPNELWSWDITYLATNIAGLFFRLYLVMDIYSRKIVGWEVHERETSDNAATLIEKACWAEHVRGERLVLHSDNGSPMKGATMLAKLQQLGIMPSFSRPSVSNDNPFSESLFGTMKYLPMYPSKPFESLEAAREWVHEFVRWYNQQHRHSALKFVTPGERHEGMDKAILLHRQAVYEAARQCHPERWSGQTRNWEQVGPVWLNPENESSEQSKKVA